MKDVLDLCHARGITEVVSLERSLFPEVLERLTSCHSHVFIIDQSTSDPSEGYVRLGLSANGLKCLQDVL
jgi:hypothetical protein